ncbi:MAG: hypothetical protein JO326_04715 [Acetobacteraceae bacterium]|nr:hypothetical protein [Acetobacteraceae bacterium]
MLFQSDHPLRRERRRRRTAEAQRCVAIAIMAQSEKLAAAMIDEAINFAALERTMPAVPEMVNAGASS